VTSEQAAHKKDRGQEGSLKELPSCPPKSLIFLFEKEEKASPLPIHFLKKKLLRK
jgi:hypothetical protein